MSDLNASSMQHLHPALGWTLLVVSLVLFIVAAWFFTRGRSPIDVSVSTDNSNNSSSASSSSNNNNNSGDNSGDNNSSNTTTSSSTNSFIGSSDSNGAESNSNDKSKQAAALRRRRIGSYLIRGPPHYPLALV
jgi:cytoskeletal protein RodZ